MRKIFLILHNLRSVHNVGSIFRTADAVGIAKIFLTGYTPAPTDRFGREVKDFAKTALGAQNSVPWESARDIVALISKLKKQNVKLVALEQDRKSVHYKKFKPKFPLALIVGNEVRGLSPAILKKCDAIIEIPMRGAMVRQAHHPRNRKAVSGKESLNVSVATGVALYQLMG